MARAATVPELALLRTEGQFSKLYLAIHAPATIYSARLNGAPTSNDSVAELTYDGGSGTYYQHSTGHDAVRRNERRGV